MEDLGLDKSFTDLLQFRNCEHANEEACASFVTVDPKRQCKEGSDVCQIDVHRERYFQACDPPQLTTAAHGQKRKELFPGSQQPAREFFGDPDGNTKSYQAYLTKEGKRQVRKV